MITKQMIRRLIAAQELGLLDCSMVDLTQHPQYKEFVNHVNLLYEEVNQEYRNKREEEWKKELQKLFET